MGVNQMVGTPWHTEKMTRAEGDSRRHQTRCKYYLKDTKKCNYQGMGCMGSAHCDYYCERVQASDVEETPSKTIVAPKESPSIDLRTVLKERMTVEHMRYGRGVVASVTKDKVDILFDKKEEKVTFNGESAPKKLIIVGE